MEPNIKEDRRAAGQSAFGSRRNAGNIEIEIFEGNKDSLGYYNRYQWKACAAGDPVSCYGEGNDKDILRKRVKKQLESEGYTVTFKNDNGVQEPTADQVQQGISEEAEHADMIAWLKAYVAEHAGQFPPDTEIEARIAEKHLSKDPEYYKKLAVMEGDKKNEIMNPTVGMNVTTEDEHGKILKGKIVKIISEDEVEVRWSDGDVSPESTYNLRGGGSLNGMDAAAKDCKLMITQGAKKETIIEELYKKHGLKPNEAEQMIEHCGGMKGPEGKMNSVVTEEDRRNAGKALFGKINNAPVALDPLEQQVYDDMLMKGYDSDKALHLVWNMADGDESQISEGLLKYGKSKGWEL